MWRASLGKFRDECLNRQWFVASHDVRHEIVNWQQDYDQVRPHSALSNVPPEEYGSAAGDQEWESRHSPYSLWHMSTCQKKVSIFG